VAAQLTAFNCLAQRIISSQFWYTGVDPVGPNCGFASYIDLVYYGKAMLLIPISEIMIIHHILQLSHLSFASKDILILVIESFRIFLVRYFHWFYSCYLFPLVL